MADQYSVKKITKGVDAGRWGVYKGSRLMYAYDSKKDATRDKNRRNKDS